VLPGDRRAVGHCLQECKRLIQRMLLRVGVEAGDSKSSWIGLNTRTAWRPSTEKWQFAVCSNSDSLMGMEMRIILRRPIMQPIPITPAKIVGSEGRRW
jgi:hypothetical protein